MHQTSPRQRGESMLAYHIAGALGLEYTTRQYKGGAPTIIGAIFVLLGVQFMVLALEQHFHGTDAWFLRGSAIGMIVFLLPGIVLLRYGHKAREKAN